MSVELELDLQVATEDADHPLPPRFERWVRAALAQVDPPFQRARAELTIRLVDPDESQALNLQYRGRDKPTNVLSFRSRRHPVWTRTIRSMICSAIW